MGARGEDFAQAEKIWRRRNFPPSLLCSFSLRNRHFFKRAEKYSPSPSSKAPAAGQTAPAPHPAPGQDANSFLVLQLLDRETLCEDSGFTVRTREELSRSNNKHWRTTGSKFKASERKRVFNAIGLWDFFTGCYRSQKLHGVRKRDGMFVGTRRKPRRCSSLPLSFARAGASRSGAAAFKPHSPPRGRKYNPGVLIQISFFNHQTAFPPLESRLRGPRHHGWMGTIVPASGFARIKFPAGKRQL